MKRNVVACLYSMAAVALMAGCQQMPDAAKTLDPSGLRITGEAINYNTNERDVTWDFTDTHPCNGDVITWSGSSHFIDHVGFDSLGGLHHTSNVIARGKGTGTSGKAYTMFDQEKFSDQAPANPQGAIILDKQELRVNGPAAGDDYTTVFQDRIVIDSQGNPTMTVSKDSSICK